jgi:serine/threonine protein kinase
MQGSSHEDPAGFRQLAQGEKIFDLYFWDEVIQEGGCGGKVVVCSPKVPGETGPPLGSTCTSPTSGKDSRREDRFSQNPEPAMVHGTHVMKIKAKAVLRKTGSEDQFRKAHLKLLNLPHHSGILPLYEVLEDDSFYYVVMERANGGSLLSSLLEEFSDGIMPERAVKQLMKEILSAIAHIHRQGMLHRDIKVDNLVVQKVDEPSSPGGIIRTVKLIDFDISDADWKPSSMGMQHHGWVGTMRNSAPETFRGIYSQRSDLYSLGTVLYLLMAGRQPYDDGVFEGVSESAHMDFLYDRLAAAKVEWNLSCWDAHPVCRDFCMSLLAFDPDRRPASAEEATEHPWFACRYRNW